MATSTERVRRMRERRRLGITQHACTECGAMHYAEVTPRHTCPACGHDHEVSNAPLQVTERHTQQSVTPDIAARLEWFAVAGRYWQGYAQALGAALHAVDPELAAQIAAEHPAPSREV